MRNRLLLLLWATFILIPIVLFTYTNNWKITAITFFSELILFYICTLFYLRWTLKRQDNAEIWVINKMTDKELEDFITNILTHLGCTVIKLDREHPDISFLLTTPMDSKAIVKIKSHKRVVGIRLVERTFKQLDIHQADECWVITNNSYTSQAREFAKKKKIRLHDRDQLIKWILKVKKEEDKKYRS